MSAIFIVYNKKMLTLLFAAQIAFFIQLLHSLEELATGFHRKWYLFSMPFWVFFLFEVCFSLFWFIAIFTESVPYKTTMLHIFLLLMFANGVQHLVWLGWAKKYNPGFVTSLVHLGWFISYYFSFVSN